MTRAQHVKAWLRRSIVLLPILGVTWSFGLLTFISSTVVFHYLFTIFNSLQGFVIFFNFCIIDYEVSHVCCLLFPSRKEFCCGHATRSQARAHLRTVPTFCYCAYVLRIWRYSGFLWGTLLIQGYFCAV